MHLLPLHTAILQKGDDVAVSLEHAAEENQELRIKNYDVVVVSSKAIATTESRIVDLSKVHASKEAAKLSKECGRSPAFCQAVLEETSFRNGIVHGTCPGAIITELKPNGLIQGMIITANAGMDESNVSEGFAVGWPEDPVRSVQRLRKAFEKHMKDLSYGRLAMSYTSDDAQNVQSEKCRAQNLENKAQSPKLKAHLAVILSDSCLKPRRWGVTAFALAVSGLDPLLPQAGRKDLYGKPLHITTEAVADQLATAANFLMGNAAQRIPAVIVRDHGLTLSDYQGWVPGVEPREDLFGGAGVKV